MCACAILDCQYTAQKTRIACTCTCHQHEQLNEGPTPAHMDLLECERMWNLPAKEVS